VNEKSNEKVNVEDPLFKKYERGINFYAHGNEPFWYLEMDFDKRFRFNETDREIISMEAVKGDKAQDANIIRFWLTSNKDEMIISISDIGCKDNMSGKLYSHTLTLEYKEVNKKDFITYKGCGEYVPDYRLNDVWVLEKLGGIAVSGEEFEFGLPSLEFKLCLSSADT